MNLLRKYRTKYQMVPIIAVSLVMEESSTSLLTHLRADRTLLTALHCAVCRKDIQTYAKKSNLSSFFNFVTETKKKDKCA